MRFSWSRMRLRMRRLLGVTSSGDLSRRNTGSLIAFETGESITYGLFNAQERGALFIGAGVPVYAGMVVGGGRLEGKSGVFLQVYLQKYNL